MSFLREPGDCRGRRSPPSSSRPVRFAPPGSRRSSSRAATRASTSGTGMPRWGPDLRRAPSPRANPPRRELDPIETLGRSLAEMAWMKRRQGDALLSWERLEQVVLLEDQQAGHVPHRRLLRRGLLLRLRRRPPPGCEGAGGADAAVIDAPSTPQGHLRESALGLAGAGGAGPRRRRGRRRLLWTGRGSLLRRPDRLQPPTRSGNAILFDQARRALGAPLGIGRAGGRRDRAVRPGLRRRRRPGRRAPHLRTPGRRCSRR